MANKDEKAGCGNCGGDANASPRIIIDGHSYCCMGCAKKELDKRKPQLDMGAPRA